MVVIGEYTTSRGVRVLCRSNVRLTPIDGDRLPAPRAALSLCDGAGRSLGMVWMKLRDDSFVLSNVELTRQRQGIGTGLVEMLLNKFLTHSIAGEAPNHNAVVWHLHLECKFGDRMIRFTENEILQNASKSDADLYFGRKQRVCSEHQ